VLEAMGVAVELPVETAVACLRATGFMFLYAPLLHPTLRRVAAVRKSLGFRTIFNLAGPLTNPANAQTQIIGVFAANRVSPIAETLANLRVRHALVVHGLDGLDELTLSGESMVAEVLAPDDTWDVTDPDRTPRKLADIRHYRIHPHKAGLPPASLETLQGGETVAENAAILEAILLGEKGPRRDVVILNAAGALLVAGIAADLREGVARAAEAIDSGAANKTLAALRDFSKSVLSSGPLNNSSSFKRSPVVVSR
jgi:anthranilate phosphoribosyltransferase